MSKLELIAVPNFPDVKEGDSLTHLISEAIAAAGLTLQDHDVVCVAQKIVSKAEGQYRQLEDVSPSPLAEQVARETVKDPRLIELILQESSEISRQAPGVIITRHRLGFTSANSGIDRSNVAQGESGETVLLLPQDPDHSAESLRQSLHELSGAGIGLIITDSHGRPFRIGTVGVAIGVAGLPAVWDQRGSEDRYGYELQATEIGFADEIAAAAGLLMGQAAEGTPVIIVRGLTLPAHHGRASDLYRPPEKDLYR